MKKKWLYRAERSQAWGLGINGSLVYGLTLVPLTDSTEDEDPLLLELGEGLLDAQVSLPEEGLVEGAVYQAFTDTWPSSWELTIHDSFMVKLVRVGGHETPSLAALVYDFLKSEYTNINQEDGEFVSPEAREVWNAVCKTLGR